MKNETIKTLEALANEYLVVTSETLQGILGPNENIDVDSLTNNEKFSLLVYRELATALEGENRHLVLDANYAKSGKHNKTEAQLAKGQCNQWLVDYYRVVDDNDQSLIQVYVKKPNYKQGYVQFSLATSCEEMNREQLTALVDELRFAVQYDKKTGRPKTSAKDDVSYAGIAEVVKTVCAILEGTKATKTAAKEAKAKAAAEAKKARATAKAEKAKEKKPEPKKEEPKATKPTTKVKRNRAKKEKVAV